MASRKHSRGKKSSRKGKSSRSRGKKSRSRGKKSRSRSRGKKSRSRGKKSSSKRRTGKKSRSRGKKSRSRGKKSSRSRGKKSSRRSKSRGKKSLKTRESKLYPKIYNVVKKYINKKAPIPKNTLLTIIKKAYARLLVKGHLKYLGEEIIDDITRIIGEEPLSTLRGDKVDKYYKEMSKFNH